MSTDVLGSYLQDHLGGANAGVELARRLHRQADGGPDAAELERLADDIEQDREVLRALVAEIAASGHTLKEAIGWVAGAAHRIAVDPHLTGDAGLSLLLEAETLALGIEGKRALWEALVAVETAYPHLAGTDLRGLVARAIDQRARIEAVRLAAAGRAFASPD